MAPMAPAPPMGGPPGGVVGARKCSKYGIITWVFPKRGGFTPQIIHLLIGFSLINHPFWGTTIFWKHPHTLRIFKRKPLSEERKKR